MVFKVEISKQWPVDQIWPAACFFYAPPDKNSLHISKWLKKNKKDKEEHVESINVSCKD